MPKVQMIDITGNKVSDVELDENIFGVEVSRAAMYIMVKNYLANQRQGTQSTKTRTEVSGGGRKPWRQKGTGRARQGSIRSPQWKGGGVALGPKPRSYSFDVNKKVKRLAMKSALTTKLNNQKMIVVDSLNLDEIKTKKMVEVLGNIKADEKVLIVTADTNNNVVRSANNIPGVKTTIVTTLNVYDILKYNSFVVTKDAVDKIQEVYV